MNAATALDYRPCAGIMLLNRDGKVFVGQRIDAMVEAWQMPQGGIDDGEDPEIAALRELGEETGIAPDKVALIAVAAEELFYDLPEDLVGKVWKGKWRGQRQRWFLYQFLGEDADVNIATAHPEFKTWDWITPETLPDVIVPFKQQLYREVLAAFAPHLAR
ncbi:RNA pyrophosphohydrolase [Sphingomonas sp.]|uniref:RNA pyrophosphohydrolase n=1 Tax=Sphingomonas sp. TaxID=28214 RepID=UPI00333ED3C1